jgi:hypothetical protein
VLPVLLSVPLPTLLSSLRVIILPVISACMPMFGNDGVVAWSCQMKMAELCMYMLRPHVYAHDMYIIAAVYLYLGVSTVYVVHS